MLKPIAESRRGIVDIVTGPVTICDTAQLLPGLVRVTSTVTPAEVSAALVIAIE